METEFKSEVDVVDSVRELAVESVHLCRKVAKDPAGEILAAEFLKAVLDAGFWLAGRNHAPEACAELRKAIFCFEILIESRLASDSDILPLLDKAHRLCALLNRPVDHPVPAMMPGE